MIKLLLEMAWKEVLVLIVSLGLLFIFFSGIEIRIKPFSISFESPILGIGIVLIALGITLCLGSVYDSGRNYSDYDTGYKKGFNEGVNHVIDYAKKKEKDGCVYNATSQEGGAND